MAEIVIVGGGIAGGALSIVLARAGFDVVVLERSLQYEDRVRGEWLAPWGAAEARELGLYDALREAGGHTLTTHTTFDELLDPATAEAAGFALDTFTEGIEGPLCLGHPASCDLYERIGRDEGVVVRRGVSSIRVEAGAPPTVHYKDSEGEHELRPKLIVGADGRDSTIRRQLGIGYHEDPVHHLFAGLLIENASGWPEEHQAICTEGDVSFLAFPQGNGRVRLYAAYALDQKTRFSGPQGAQRLIEACVMRCCPPSQALAEATPAGPCRSFKNSDTIAERVTLPGVVLVGDAAGHNDPLIGQGLSITMRDLRLVRDALLRDSDWSPTAFADYANDRRERLRRLRLAACLQSRIEADFSDEARLLRGAFMAEVVANPERPSGLTAALGGPESVPAEMFDELENAFDFPERPAWPLTPA